jgi:hypothetical protein
MLVPCGPIGPPAPVNSGVRLFVNTSHGPLMTKTFRHSAGFGKRIEYWIIGLMLKEGMDVYVPLVDDHAVDAIVRRKDGSIALVQIKARSSTVKIGDASLYAAITHEHREDYWFVFYSERLDSTFLLSSKEFLAESVQNKTGKNVGLRGIWFNGTKTDKATGKKVEYIKDRYLKYVVQDFSRLANGELINE